MSNAVGKNYDSSGVIHCERKERGFNLFFLFGWMRFNLQY